jgi:hypothetical protein
MSTPQIEEAILSLLEGRPMQSFPESKIWQHVEGGIREVQRAVQELVAQRKIERIPPQHLRLISHEVRKS